MTDAQKEAAIQSIANVSRLLRDAIAAAIPVAPEQYLCISVPGTVIDTTDIANGGTFVYSDFAFTPPQVRQAEAKLVDSMLPLANVMIGNTGKSVARSYERALDALVPQKATVKSAGGAIRSPGDPTYDAAMVYLTTKDTITGLTPVDIYIWKQKLWAEAQDAWEYAKSTAQRDAAAMYPGDLAAQRQNYDDWNQVNYRKYKFAVQGKWMDWVSNGDKYNVEYNFAIIDIDSIMALVENSKESIRNSTMVDADGANEVFGVNLTPKNWATLCKQKVEGWFAKNGNYSVDQINAEILRLQNLLLSYQTLSTLTSTNPPTYPITGGDTTPPVVNSLSTAFSHLYAAEATLNGLIEKGVATTDQSYLGAKETLDGARYALRTALEDNRIATSELNKYNLANLQGSGDQAALATWIKGKETIIQSQIAALQEQRLVKLRSLSVTEPVITGAVSPGEGADGPDTGGVSTTGTVFAPIGSELAAPVFGLTTAIPTSTDDSNSNLPVAGTASDPWTTIKLSYSAANQSSTATTSSWGFSVGGGFGWGLWSVGGSYAHDQTQNDSAYDMANCDVSVTFSALVVNIGRPWLYGEIFNDFELDTADGIYLSPGAQSIHDWMKKQATDPTYVARLAQYNSFPAYPTSFIVATDTSIEFTGNTQHIEKHFSAETNSGSISIGYGPFSVSSSFHQESSSQSYQMQSTATGCKLLFGAPQIIGWVSQIVPALPRDPLFVPLVQNVTTTS